MLTIVINMCDLCPERASFSAIAASVGEGAFAHLACSNDMMVSSEGACNAYYRFAGVLK